MNSGLTFVLALAAWLVLGSITALAVAHMVHEADRDLRTLRRFEQRPFRRPPA